MSATANFIRGITSTVKDAITWPDIIGYKPSMKVEPTDLMVHWTEGHLDERLGKTVVIVDRKNLGKGYAFPKAIVPKGEGMFGLVTSTGKTFSMKEKYIVKRVEQGVEVNVLKFPIPIQLFTSLGDEMIVFACFGSPLMDNSGKSIYAFGFTPLDVPETFEPVEYCQTGNGNTVPYGKIEALKRHSLIIKHDKEKLERQIKTSMKMDSKVEVQKPMKNDDEEQAPYKPGSPGYGPGDESEIDFTVISEEELPPDVAKKDGEKEHHPKSEIFPKVSGTKTDSLEEGIIAMHKLLGLPIEVCREISLKREDLENHSYQRVKSLRFSNLT